MFTNEARDRPRAAKTPNRRKEFELANTIILLEYGPAGAVARVERGDTKEYAGPLPDDTVDAIETVARRKRNGC